MATKFHGLPGDEDMARRTFQKRFEDAFGKTANLRELYLADPCFFRFARLFPRPAYLLQHLRTFDTDLIKTLDIFVAEYWTPKMSAISVGPPPFEDPFSFFNIGYDYSWFLLHLRATLIANTRSTEPLAYEIAKDVLDILHNPDRQAIVDELLSADLATELEKRVSHMGELGFWQVRKAISRTETIFSNNFVYIRDLLERREDDAVKDNCSYRRRENVGRSTNRASSPFGRERSFTPSSSTFNDPDTEIEEWVSPRRKRRFE